jgi:surfactin synthase thioesterase subunit
MESWFPSLGDSAYTSEPLIVAFHGAGSTESAFSSAGTGKRRVDTLLNGAQERGITIASVQLPGRGKRSYEPALQSAPGIAQKLVNEALEPLIVQNHHSFNQFRKYIIVAHSMVSLIAVEAMKHLRKRWKDERVLPRILIVSCFPAPNTPHNDLPWNPSGSKLSNNEFQHELKLWDVNEAVWKSERVWSMYNEMLRNDFKVCVHCLIEVLYC